MKQQADTIMLPLEIVVAEEALGTTFNAEIDGHAVAISLPVRINKDLLGVSMGEPVWGHRIYKACWAVTTIRAVVEELDDPTRFIRAVSTWFGTFREWISRRTRCHRHSTPVERFGTVSVRRAVS